MEAKNPKETQDLAHPQRILKLHALDPRRKAVLILGSLIATLGFTAAATTLTILGNTPTTQLAMLNIGAIVATLTTTWLITRLGRCAARLNSPARPPHNEIPRPGRCSAGTPATTVISEIVPHTRERQSVRNQHRRRAAHEAAPSHFGIVRQSYT